MSSISFPHDADAPGFYPSAFDGAASFQMNPLSAHPPRTPRASTAVAPAEVYGVQVYTPAPEPEPLHEPDAGARVQREAVWRAMLTTSTGRDKAFVRPRAPPGMPTA